MKAKWSGLVFLVASGLLAQSQSADQLRDLANQAKGSKDMQSESSYLCQAAVLDEKKYEKKCKQIKDELYKRLAQFQADFAMGSHELQEKNYAVALRHLQKITFGPNMAAAQELMHQASIGINGGIPIDPASLNALKAGREAYLHGDFGLAESQFRLIQSSQLRATVTQTLTNITIYRDTMKQAESAFQIGNLKVAAEKYQFAAAIYQNGPGSPLDRLRDVLAAEARTEVAKQPAADDFHAVRQAKSLPPTKMNHSAKAKDVSDSAQHRVVPRSRKDMAIAPENWQEDPADRVESLNTGVANFYASHFSQADDAISAYLKNGGKHFAGAAHFYLGASLVMQTFLSTPQKEKAVSLRRQAQSHFFLAMQLHYKPIESAVSPKVFAEWTRINDQQ